VLALDTMVRENLFICPRCSNPVRFEACSWRCSNTSCRYAEEPFSVVSGVFRRFECIDSACVAGAGTASRWSIDYFVRARTRSRRLGRLAVLCFFWLSWIDRILDPRHTIDGTSSVFFLGRKSEVSITEADIIDYYQGGMSEIAVRDRA
jgi:hypothetical protein